MLKKFSYFLFLFFVISFTSKTSLAQGAKESYDLAKKAFESGDNIRCLQALNQAELALGGSNAKIESLKCQAHVMNSDWINAGKAYMNFERLIPESSKQGEAYEVMLEYKTEIWKELAEIEKRKKEAIEQEMKDDLALAVAAQEAQETLLEEKVAKINEKNEQELYKEAMSSKNKELLELYQEEMGASKTNHLEAITTEIDKHNNPTAFLLKAIKADDLKEFNYLVELGADLKWDNLYEQSLIHLCIVENASEIFDRLIELKADLEYPDTDGNTPLIIAIKSSKQKFVLLLLKNGASPSAINKKTLQPPVYYALNGDHSNSGEALFQKGVNPNEWITYKKEQMSPLYYAITYLESTNFAACILKYGAKIDSLGPNGLNALMAVVRIDEKPKVNFLLNHGASINIPGLEQKTALHLAVEKRNYAMTAYLIQRGGADKKAKDAQGRTPQKMAVPYKNKGLNAILIKSNSLINPLTSCKVHEQQYLLGYEKIELQSYVDSLNRIRNGRILLALGLLAGTAYMVKVLLSYPKEPENNWQKAFPWIVGGVGGPAVFIAYAAVLDSGNRKIEGYRPAKRRIKEINIELQELGM